MNVSILNWRPNLRQLWSQWSWPTAIGLTLIVGLALVVRLHQPITHKNIGEIDVFYWALRTQQFELHGFHAIGTNFWVLPVVMATLHRIIGGQLYDLFLWGGSIISSILPTLAIFWLTKEVARSRIAGLVGALAYAVLPIVFYRGVFTVSETFAYVFIPWCLFLCVRLIRRRQPAIFILLVLSVLLALQTHDSAKLLVLPAAVASIYYFIVTRHQRVTQILVLLSLIGVVGLLVFDKQLLAEIRFFLFPNNSGNTAFGHYSPVEYATYRQNFPLALNLLALLGVALALWKSKFSRINVVLLICFLVPILYYQQIEPRISGSTIVPFRLMPYVTFVFVPLVGLAVQGWLNVLPKRSFAQILGISALVVLFVSQISVADFPLTYITSLTEQTSLRRLPLTAADYVITQTGLIGMTAVATRTNEANYFGDSGDQIFGATSTADLRQRLARFEAAQPRPTTGILISKWKLDNRDPYYGWWDSLVNPKIQLSVFRAANLPVRFEDQNLVLFNLPR